MFNYRSVHLEISSKCTLKCPRCPRTELEPDTINQEVSLYNFQIGFPKSVISKIESFIFCGSIGDPIYATEFLEIVEYIKTHSAARIQVVTNGSYKKSDWWQRLGQMLSHNDQVTFSVDGWDNQSNNLYRVHSDFDSIVLGIQSLRAGSKCNIKWSAIYFAFNQQKINHMRELAKSLGCDQFQTVKSSKFDHRYAVNNEDVLKPSADLVASTEVYEIQVQQLSPDKYIPIALAVPTHPHAWAKCLNYKKELYVDVDGTVLPCPWFDSNYQVNKFVEQNRQKLSIRNRSFFDIIDDVELWKELINSFDQHPLEICLMKCKNGKQ